MASKKFTQFDTANNTSETEISVGVKGGDNFKRANYLTATTNPTVTDDGSDGFTVGSMWFNASTGVMYVCKDSTVGAAVWSVLSSGFSRSVFVFQLSSNSATLSNQINTIGGAVSLVSVADWSFDFTRTGGDAITGQVVGSIATQGFEQANVRPVSIISGGGNLEFGSNLQVLYPDGTAIPNDDPGIVIPVVIIVDYYPNGWDA